MDIIMNSNVLKFLRYTM